MVTKTKGKQKSTCVPVTQCYRDGDANLVNYANSAVPPCLTASGSPPQSYAFAAPKRLHLLRRLAPSRLAKLAGYSSSSQLML